MENYFEFKYILNPDYILRTDKNRVILASRMNAEHYYCICCHPVISIILSFFNGEDIFMNTIKKISKFWGMEDKYIIRFIKPFMDNQNPFCLSYDGEEFWFPDHIIIKNELDIKRVDIEPEKLMILPPYDFKTLRLSIPLRILFILNTNCVTDCIYCYADKKSLYQPMPLERILRLIDEAYELGVESFDLSGGEIFVYQHWELLLKKLYGKGYDPYISTKVPLTKTHIDKLFELGTRKIQISLDTLDPVLLAKTLKVSPEYCNLIKKTISYLDQKGFAITIKSTLTKETCTVNNLIYLLDFIRKFPNIQEYTYTAVGYSHYKGVKAFNHFKPTMDQIIDMRDFFEQLDKDNFHFAFRRDDGNVTDGAECCCVEEFNRRPLCTGNVFGVVVLPDGKVTICEEMYWNEHFILGDLMENSLLQVWQSEKALKIWKIDKNLISKKSPCRQCEEFEACRYEKGVCWKEVMAVYGKQRWTFPDIHCPKAPKPIYPVFYDNTFLSSE